jgi:GNAT superfamily N-acetyltransferase
MSSAPRRVRGSRWEHGTVMRASRFPGSFDLNVVRIEDNPRLGVDQLIDFADSALAGFAHRQIDFADASVAEPLRAEFHANGFESTRLVLMRLEGSTPAPPGVPIVEVDYDALQELRSVWYEEDFPGHDHSDFDAEAREVRIALGTRSLALYDGTRPVAFATLDLGDREAEVAGLFVLPEYRGQGRGTALAQAAIAAAGDVKNLWICAEDEGRPKQMYARLGFRPIVAWTQFLRLPER